MLKIVLFIIGFFVVIFVIMVIFILVGVTALSTFCHVLKEVNSGNVNILDELPLNYTNFNKLIIKECVGGPDGNLLKYSHLYMNSDNYMYNIDIQNVYPGI